MARTIKPQGARKPKALQKKADSQEKDLLYVAAVCHYEEELYKPASDHLGLWKICEEVSNEHFAKTYNRIILFRSTPTNQVNGVYSCLYASTEQIWEIKEEAEQIINFAVEMA